MSLRRLVFSKATMAKKRKRQVPWSDSEIALLGTMSDGEVADAIGRSRWAVTTKRCRMEIAPFETQHGYTWEPWEIALLGTVVDQVAADQLGVSKRTIIRKRQELGIAAFKN